MDGWQRDYTEEKEVVGYKMFNGDFTNRYGMKYELGQTYYKEGNIRFGLGGNGFHFCRNFEDTFKYYDTSEDFILAEVVGSGKLVEYNDEYYEFFQMYASSELKIVRIIDRKEIMEMAKKISYIGYRFKRFIQLYYLTEEEEKELIELYPKYEDYILNQRERKMKLLEEKEKKMTHHM